MMYRVYKPNGFIQDFLSLDEALASVAPYLPPSDRARVIRELKRKDSSSFYDFTFQKLRYRATKITGVNASFPALDDAIEFAGRTPYPEKKVKEVLDKTGCFCYHGTLIERL